MRHVCVDARAPSGVLHSTDRRLTPGVGPHVTEHCKHNVVLITSFEHPVTYLTKVLVKPMYELEKVSFEKGYLFMLSAYASMSSTYSS